MRHTFHLNASNLTPGFFERVKKLFGDKEIKVVIEDVNHGISQQDFHQSLIGLRELFKDVKVDPNIDVSKLADEVNL